MVFDVEEKGVMVNYVMGLKFLFGCGVCGFNLYFIVYSKFIVIVDFNGIGSIFFI